MFLVVETLDPFFPQNLLRTLTRGNEYYFEKMLVLFKDEALQMKFK